MSEVQNLVVPKSCIMFATADWNEPYWTNKQHSAKSLAEIGTQVLYVESIGLRSPKAGSARDWGRLWNRLRNGLASLFFGAVERAPGVFVLSPLLIPAGYRHPLTRALNRWSFRLAIARATRKLRICQPLVWTYHPFMLDAIGGMEVASVLYHCVDDLAAVPGVDAQAFRDAERQLLARANVVFATSPALTEHCLFYNDNTHFFPNVVDIEHFGSALQPGEVPDDLASIPKPRICYHGVLSDFKIDFQLLLEAARLKTEWSWVFVGEEREGQHSPLVAELKTLPNVHFLGYKPYAQLPDYLRGMQVGLLPSLINDYTCAMFPMKYHEYLAAGLPVIATELAFSKSVDTKGLIVVDSPESLVRGVSRQLERGRLNLDAVAQIVGSNTWQSRLSNMLEILDLKS
jgi:glycosyltransferase involved in cell wall biosynthesis